MQSHNPSFPQPFEVIEVTRLEVACDGGIENQKLGLGHPRVFLHIDPDRGDVVCPYCSRQYVLKPGSGHHGH